jgi:tetratricopeptide (TPR) repeat protein
VATHAECAVELANAVRLRPDAAARDVAPLGIAALGRLARRALANIEPAASIAYGERAAVLSPDGLPLPDQLVHARALLRLGRADEALAYGEKIAAGADEEPVYRAEALLVVGRAHEALGDGSRAVAAWQEALEVATDAELAPERANAMRRLGMADFLAGRLSQASSRFAAGVPGDAGGRRPARPGLGAAEPGLGHHHAGRLRRHRRGARPRARLFAELGRSGRAFLAARARRRSPGCWPAGCRRRAAWPGSSCRSGNGSVRAGRSARCGRSRRTPPPSSGTSPRRTGRRGGPYREFAAVNDDWGRGLRSWSGVPSPAGLAEPDHAIDLFTGALDFAGRTGHPLLLGHGRHAARVHPPAER